MSIEQKKYLKRIKLNKFLIHFTQIFLLVLILVLWEFLSSNNYINSFITSSPSRIIKTIKNLYLSNNLFIHIFVTLKECIISFILTTIISFLIAIIMYYNRFISKVIEPYLIMLNSLPKVALGPIIIIWIGANIKGIITMAILISLIVSIQSLYNGFISTDKLKIKLLKTFNASNLDILFHVIIPYNKETIFGTLKINLSMCLIGVIMGEFLTSKAGIGYLILYGSQVFNLDLVMSGIFILTIISILLYLIINVIKKIFD